MNNKIGIMQGRLIPEYLNKLQFFPISNWEKELELLTRINCRLLEILFDKELHLDKILKNSAKMEILGLLQKHRKEFQIKSLCADYLTSISILEYSSQDYFVGIIKNLVVLLSKTTVRIIVVPFFDNNQILKKTELNQVLKIFEDYKLDPFLIKNGISLALEINLPAKELKEQLDNFKFKNIKICYDIGNATSMGFNTFEEIMLLGDLIVHIHIKDRLINGPNVQLGKGNVNWVDTIRAIDKINYKGIFILETPYSSLPIDDAKNNLLFITEIMRVYA